MLYLLPLVLFGMQAASASHSSVDSTGQALCLVQQLRYLPSACHGGEGSPDNDRYLRIWAWLATATAYCIEGEIGAAQAISTSGSPTPPASANGTFFVLPALPAFQEHAANFTARSGLNITVTPMPTPIYNQRRIAPYPTAGDPGPLDWWEVSAEVFGEANKRGALLDLTQVLWEDERLAWADIPPAWRGAVSSSSRGVFTTLPLSLAAYTMYYRKDLFKQYNISAPNTWDDLLHVMRAYGNRDLDDDGIPEYGMCFESQLACGFINYFAMFVWASSVQYLGPAQGAVFDPDTMQALYTTPAGEEAFRIIDELRNYSVPENATCNSAVFAAHHAGHCLMTWNWSPALFKMGSFNKSTSAMRGVQGLLQMPGSPHVWNRTTWQRMTCTHKLCPYSTDETDPATGAPRVVNRILPVESISFAMNAFSPLSRMSTAYALLADFISPERRKAVMLRPETEIGPLRSSDLVREDWVAAGYEPGDVDAYLHMFEHLTANENPLLELRFEGAFDIIAVERNLTRRVLQERMPWAEAAALAQAETDAALARNGGKEYQREVYRQSIRYTTTRPSQVGAAASSDDDHHKHSKSWIIVVVVVDAAVLVALAFLAVLVYRRWRRRRAAAAARNCALLAPRAGQCTTLLVTDIESSTNLWESLPASVMDVALHVHHDTIRGVLIECKGYESATEGDSFILAFNDGAHALRFALVAQQALLAADWPAELLASPYGCKMAVQYDAEAASRAEQLLNAPALLRGVPGLAPARRNSLAETVGAQRTASGGGAGPAAGRGGAGAGAGGGPLFGSSSAGGGGSAAAAIAGASRPSSAQGPLADIFESLPDFSAATAVLQAAAAAPAAHDLGSGAEPPSAAASGPSWGSLVQHSVRQLASPPGGASAYASPDHAASTMAARRALWGSATDRPPLPPAAAAAASPGNGAGFSSAMRPFSSPAHWLDCHGLLGSGGTPPPSLGASPGPGRGSGEDVFTLQTTATLRTILQAVYPQSAAAHGGHDGECVASTVQPAEDVSTNSAVVGSSGAGGARELAILRGLRVRMGMHSGVNDTELQHNRVTQRMAYSGRALTTAKAVADAGCGGHVMLSGRALMMMTAGRRAATGLPAHVLFHCGRHALKGVDAPLDLYCVHAPQLVPRAAWLAGLRTQAIKAPDVLSAPLGHVAVGAALLGQELADVLGPEALLRNHAATWTMAQQLAALEEGCLLPTYAGALIGVFQSSQNAIMWLLRLRGSLLNAAKETGQLASPPMGEVHRSTHSELLRVYARLGAWSTGSTEKDSGVAAAASQAAARAGMRQSSGELLAPAAVLSWSSMRGGVDCGPLMGSLLATHGRMTYSGGAIRSACSMATHAVDWQVLASVAAARQVPLEMQAPIMPDHEPSAAMLELPGEEAAAVLEGESPPPSMFELAEGSTVGEDVDMPLPQAAAIAGSSGLPRRLRPRGASLSGGAGLHSALTTSYRRLIRASGEVGYGDDGTLGPPPRASKAGSGSTGVAPAAHRAMDCVSFEPSSEGGTPLQAAGSGFTRGGGGGGLSSHPTRLGGPGSGAVLKPLLGAVQRLLGGSGNGSGAAADGGEWLSRRQVREMIQVEPPLERLSPLPLAAATSVTAEGSGTARAGLAQSGCDGEKKPLAGARQAIKAWYNRHSVGTRRDGHADEAHKASANEGSKTTHPLATDAAAAAPAAPTGQSSASDAAAAPSATFGDAALLLSTGANTDSVVGAAPTIELTGPRTSLNHAGAPVPSATAAAPPANTAEAAAAAGHSPFTTVSAPGATGPAPDNLPLEATAALPAVQGGAAGAADAPDAMEPRPLIQFGLDARHIRAKGVAGGYIQGGVGHRSTVLVAMPVELVLGPAPPARDGPAALAGR